MPNPKPEFQEYIGPRGGKPIPTEPRITWQVRTGNQVSIYLNQPASDLLLGVSDRKREHLVKLVYSPKLKMVGLKLYDNKGYASKMYKMKSGYMVSATGFRNQFDVDIRETRNYRAEELNGVVGFRIDSEYKRTGYSR